MLVVLVVLLVARRGDEAERERERERQREGERERESERGRARDRESSGIHTEETRLLEP